MLLRPSQPVGLLKVWPKDPATGEETLRLYGTTGWRTRPSDDPRSTQVLPLLGDQISLRASAWFQRADGYLDLGGVEHEDHGRFFLNNPKPGRPLAADRALDWHGARFELWAAMPEYYKPRRRYRVPALAAFTRRLAGTLADVLPGTESWSLLPTASAALDGPIGPYRLSGLSMAVALPSGGGKIEIPDHPELRPTASPFTALFRGRRDPGAPAVGQNLVWANNWRISIGTDGLVRLWVRDAGGTWQGQVTPVDLTSTTTLALRYDGLRLAGFVDGVPTLSVEIPPPLFAPPSAAVPHVQASTAAGEYGLKPVFLRFVDLALGDADIARLTAVADDSVDWRLDLRMDEGLGPTIKDYGLLGADATIGGVDPNLAWVPIHGGDRQWAATEPPVAQGLVQGVPLEPFTHAFGHHLVALVDPGRPVRAVLDGGARLTPDQTVTGPMVFSGRRISGALPKSAERDWAPGQRLEISGTALNNGVVTVTDVLVDVPTGVRGGPGAVLVQDPLIEETAAAATLRTPAGEHQWRPVDTGSDLAVIELTIAPTGRPLTAVLGPTADEAARAATPPAVTTLLTHLGPQAAPASTDDLLSQVLHGFTAAGSTPTREVLDLLARSSISQSGAPSILRVDADGNTRVRGVLFSLFDNWSPPLVGGGGGGPILIPPPIFRQPDFVLHDRDIVELEEIPLEDRPERVAVLFGHKARPVEAGEAAGAAGGDPLGQAQLRAWRRAESSGLSGRAAEVETTLVEHHLAAAHADVLARIQRDGRIFRLRLRGPLRPEEMQGFWNGAIGLVESSRHDFFADERPAVVVKWHEERLAYVTLEVFAR
jgi:hypothetical protein